MDISIFIPLKFNLSLFIEIQLNYFTNVPNNVRNLCHNDENNYIIYTYNFIVACFSIAGYMKMHQELYANIQYLNIYQSIQINHFKKDELKSDFTLKKPTFYKDRCIS